MSSRYAWVNYAGYLNEVGRHRESDFLNEFMEELAAGFMRGHTPVEIAWALSSSYTQALLRLVENLHARIADE